MPTSFITDDFLLESEFAKTLYHGYAKHQPIIDYHNHLPPQDIASNTIFPTITQIWLNGDHYKWRAMRTLGIEEKYITGSASDAEKFSKWAYTVPHCVRNPLYHWTHLELLRYFGINKLLSPETDRAIFDETSAKLSSQDYSTRRLLEKMNVELLCTTDDPTDKLVHHKQIQLDKFAIKVLPTFRPDKAYTFGSLLDFSAYLDRLAESADLEIRTFESLVEGLARRVNFFHEAGCRLADHGLTRIPNYHQEENVGAVFAKLRSGKEVSVPQFESFRHSILIELCRMYHAKGWVQQFHLGAMRNNNSRLMNLLGADSGFDSIGDYSQGESLSQFLNTLDKTNELAKTILYNLNPADNELFASMMGNFNDGTEKGKIQYGSAWWFLDQKDGMEKQINALSNLGLLSCFIGMITDSRSFLSFPRHEYFRRILCNMIGHDVRKGELPADEKWLGKIVTDVCYQNAKQYFAF